MSEPITNKCTFNILQRNLYWNVDYSTHVLWRKTSGICFVELPIFLLTSAVLFHEVIGPSLVGQLKYVPDTVVIKGRKQYCVFLLKIPPLSRALNYQHLINKYQMSEPITNKCTFNILQRNLYWNVDYSTHVLWRNLFMRNVLIFMSFVW
jgi:hypothetical protein